MIKRDLLANADAFVQLDPPIPTAEPCAAHCAPDTAGTVCTDHALGSAVLSRVPLRSLVVLCGHARPDVFVRVGGTVSAQSAQRTGCLVCQRVAIEPCRGPRARGRFTGSAAGVTSRPAQSCRLAVVQRRRTLDHPHGALLCWPGRQRTVAEPDCS